MIKSVHAIDRFLQVPRLFVCLTVKVSKDTRCLSVELSKARCFYTVSTFLVIHFGPSVVQFNFHFTNSDLGKYKAAHTATPVSTRAVGVWNLKFRQFVIWIFPFRFHSEILSTFQNSLSNENLKFLISSLIFYVGNSDIPFCRLLNHKQ